MQSLGIAFGAAVAGLAANAAGLAVGVSPAAVASAATWVYLLGIVPSTAMVILSGRLLWLHQRRNLRPLDGPVTGWGDAGLPRRLPARRGEKGDDPGKLAL